MTQMFGNSGNNKYAEYFNRYVLAPSSSANLPEILYSLHTGFVGMVLADEHRTDAEKLTEIRAIHEAFNAAYGTWERSVRLRLRDD
jgi:hypothetical protein